MHIPILPKFSKIVENFISKQFGGLFHQVYLESKNNTAFTQETTFLFLTSKH